MKHVESVRRNRYVDEGCVSVCLPGDRLFLKGVKEVLKRSDSSHREETCYVEALFYF